MTGAIGRMRMTIGIVGVNVGIVEEQNQEGKNGETKDPKYGEIV